MFAGMLMGLRDWLREFLTPEPDEFDRRHMQEGYYGDCGDPECWLCEPFRSLGDK